MCKIFTKYKLKHQFAQKLLSLGVSVSLMAAMVPQMAWAEEPDKFVASAKANHWGRSDLRSYLNGVAKDGETLPLDTTHETREASGYYESQFSNAEFGLVQPFTYSTNVLAGSYRNEYATATYETSDRFWLPSGNYSSYQVISWGGEDISSKAQYGTTTVNDKARIIPISYWSYGASSDSWLRSPFYYNSNSALEARRGYYVYFTYVYYYDPAVMSAFKIDLSSVIFASAASAASIAAEGGAKKISISGSSDFGKKTSNSLPDYGMYLKTNSDDKNFSAGLLNLSGTDLTVTYTGGVQDQYVVVHAFKEDSLESGHDSYVAAGKINSADSLVTIDVTNWIISSLDGYTIKVWMEDASSKSLAKATDPQTFYGTSSGISTSDTEIKNPRVFAMNDELQCSWGDLSVLSPDDYNNVLGGNATSAGVVAGANPTNQKIYFGEKDGNPLEFWIAGRETAANGGTISSDGNIMTLYQAKSVEKMQFNSSTDNYTGVGDAVTLQLADELSADYTGSPVSYPDVDTNITFSGQDSLDKNSLYWQYRANITAAWSEGMPANPGTYEIRCYAAGTDTYERTYSAPVTFKVMETPTADDFDFSAPANLTYDGSPKTATVTAKSGISGMGTVTVKYYDENGNNPAVGSDTSTAPTNVGTYTVKIDVAEGDNYNSATDLTRVDWTFTITKATPQYTVPTGLTATYGQTLNEIALPSGWAWGSPSDPVGNVGQRSHSATFTPSDPDNYNSVTENLTVTVAKATPQYTVPTELTATYGQTLSEITLPTNWEWDSSSDLVGNVGQQSHSATFMPSDLDNYNSVTENLTVTVTPDTSSWGTETEVAGISHWTDANGTTSVEVTENGMIWLKEESGGTSAWYGVDNSAGVFEIGSRFWVRWLDRDDDKHMFDTYCSLIAQRQYGTSWFSKRFDALASFLSSGYDTHAWLFEIGVTAPDGTAYTNLSQQVPVYVQIGDDWDKNSLNGYFISTEMNEQVHTTFVDNQSFPEGTDTFGVMKLSHFSLYIIYDELAVEKYAAQNQVKTGDQVSLFTISGLGLIMTLALGLILSTNSNKRKFDE